MRPIVLAIATAGLLVLSSSAYAQNSFTEEQMVEATQTVQNEKISDEAYRDGWCAVALQIVTDAMEENGETENLDNIAAARDALYNAAGQALIDGGFSTEEQEAVGKALYVIAYSQIAEEFEEPDFTQEDCTAAGNAALQ